MADPEVCGAVSEQGWVCDHLPKGHEKNPHSRLHRSFKFGFFHSKKPPEEPKAAAEMLPPNEA